MITGYYRSKI